MMMDKIIKILVIKLLFFFFVNLVQRPVLETAIYSPIGDFQFSVSRDVAEGLSLAVQ